MKTWVSRGMRECRRRWAVIMGLMVLVWRWKAKVLKVLGVLGSGKRGSERCVGMGRESY